MDREFWLGRWESQQIGFHQKSVNGWLETDWESLALPHGSAVFVPLCGKSLDMRHLASLGHRVVGVELSPVAIESFFEEAGQSFERREGATLPCYEGEGIRLYCGDFFEIAAFELEAVRGVFDRAALIALPPAMRRRYAEHLLSVLPPHAAMLLVTLEYEQSLVEGPPFSVSRDEVEELYGGRARVELLREKSVRELPPKFAAIEGVVECGFRIVLDG